MSNNFTQKNKSGGFTLLFALLVSVLVLAVGASVISVSLRQSVLSNTGRESQYAFYAANTGMECALYWDVNPPTSSDANTRVFPYTGGTIAQTLSGDLNEVKCAGGNIITGDDFSGDDNYTVAWVRNGNTTTFKIALKDASGTADIPSHNVYCAEVTVVKSFDTVEGNILTTITSQGLNTCNITNPRAVQRGLVLQYLQ